MPPKRARQDDGGESSLWLYAVSNPPPRRKACRQCFEAKVRCDHKRPICSRCARRSIHCDYTGAASDEPLRETTAEAFTLNTGSVSSEAVPTTSTALPASPSRIPTSLFPTPTPIYASPSDHPNQPNSTPFSHHHTNPSNSDINLICTVDAQRVRDRWLEGWVPRPDQQPKDLSRGTAIFIYGILKSYPRLLCEGELPAIVHGLQMEGGKLPEALANCVCIARMWEGEEGGGREIVRDTTVREMERLFAKKNECGQFELLAAFQAYVMYVTLLMDPGAEPVVLQSIMLNLQDFAHTIALTGLVHPSEHPASHNHPSNLSWRAWALAEAKRRSLFAMYMLDDVVNAFSNVSCILGDELSDLTAPCSEKLWRAKREADWRRLYDVHVAEWEGGGLKLNELWPTTGEKDSKRVEKWVKGMDGMGMMIFAVTTATQHR